MTDTDPTPCENYRTAIRDSLSYLLAPVFIGKP